jgi:hypothetical protein
MIVGCNQSTTISQDKEFLQSKYSVVYSISGYRYIVKDSLCRVYDIEITNDGKIGTSVEIR